MKTERSPAPGTPPLHPHPPPTHPPTAANFSQPWVSSSLSGSFTRNPSASSDISRGGRGEWRRVGVTFAGVNAARQDVVNVQGVRLVKHTLEINWTCNRYGRGTVCRDSMYRDASSQCRPLTERGEGTWQRAYGGRVGALAMPVWIHQSSSGRGWGLGVGGLFPCTRD